MHRATYIVLNAYRKHVSTAEYDQTQAITTMAKAAVYGVQAFLVRLCNNRLGCLAIDCVLNAYKVDDCRVELTLQPPPARAVHSNARETGGARCKATWHGGSRRVTD